MGAVNGDPAQPPIRDVTFRFNRRLGRFLPTSGHGTVTTKCDGLGRPVTAVYGSGGDVGGWKLGHGSSMRDAADVIEFWRSRK